MLLDTKKIRGLVYASSLKSVILGAQQLNKYVAECLNFKREDLIPSKQAAQVQASSSALNSPERKQTCDEIWLSICKILQWDTLPKNSEQLSHKCKGKHSDVRYLWILFSRIMV